MTHIFGKATPEVASIADPTPPPPPPNPVQTASASSSPQSAAARAAAATAGPGAGGTQGPNITGPGGASDPSTGKKALLSGES